MSRLAPMVVQAGPGKLLRILLIAWLYVVGVQAAAACPGVSNGACTQTCRLATCGALADFYKASLNETVPWEFQKGWELTATQPCSALVDPKARTPVYCSWTGVKCCSVEQIKEGLCSAAGSVYSVTLEAMNVNVSVADKEWVDSIARLHTCGLTELRIQGCNVSGAMGPEWGTFTNFTVLDLSNNWLDGTIPQSVASLKKLTVLGLGINFLQGTIPPWLFTLKQLRRINLGANGGVNPGGEEGLIGTIPAAIGRLDNLEELNLETNALTGSIPMTLCGPRTKLRILNLRTNSLSGSAEGLRACTELDQLDISGNQLNGSLPAARAWTKLVAFNAADNQFAGELMDDFYHMPALGFLDLSNNRITGEMSRRITLLTYLYQFNMRNNFLQGTMPEDMFFLPRLAELDLSHNRFTGTLSESIGLAYGLRLLNLANNPLTGSIPNVAGLLNHLREVQLSNNSLSCAGEVTPGVAPPVCSDDALLPCFLKFGDRYVPLQDNSFLQCKPIMRRELPDGYENCNETVPPDIADGETTIQEEELLRQQWQLDPSYYQYKSCKCLEGFHPGPQTNSTYLHCVHDDGKGWVQQAIWGGVAFGIAVVLAFAAWQAVRLCFKPSWMRERDMRKKRKRPLPTSGQVSIVVTDIENYSGLMSKYQESRVMTVAMRLHNALMQRIQQQQAGHVIEQEGDSWTVAFEEPQDAVAFCLQVQLALQKLDWPSALRRERDSNADQASQHESSSGLSNLPESIMEGVSRSSRMPSFASSAGQSAQTNSHSSAGDGSVHCSLGHASGAIGVSVAEHSPSQSTVGTMETNRTATEPTGPTHSLANMLPQFNFRRGETLDRASNLGSVNSLGSTLGMGSISGGSQTNAPRRRFKSGSSAGNSRLWSMFFKGGGGDGAKDSIRGLRVRMGIATGLLEGDIKACVVKDVASEVSNLAAGGQVLMDAATFDSIKGVLGELGTLDHRGYNDKLLNKKQRQARLESTCNWFRRVCCGGVVEDEDGEGEDHSDRKRQLSATDAVVLDLGSYFIPGLPEMKEASGLKSSKERWRAALLAMGRRMGTTTEGTTTCSSSEGESDARKRRRKARLLAGLSKKGDVLHVFSVYSPCLVDRACKFKNELAFPAGTVPHVKQLSKGYFEAPGACDTGPGTLWADTDQSRNAEIALPNVTMVFVLVEGGKAFARRKRSDSAIVHNLISQTLVETLAYFPGGKGQGYLCREQDGEFKYMIAFGTPAGALEWCLLMQEIAMYLPWPPQVLGVTGWGERKDPMTGQLIWRGPRLKMGLAQGQPRSIMPDHGGRADYHGVSVNNAARYCAVAAHGGQIVLEQALAEYIIDESWAGSNSSGELEDQEVGGSGSRAAAGAGSDREGRQRRSVEDTLGPITPSRQRNGSGSSLAGQGERESLGPLSPVAVPGGTVARGHSSEYLRHGMAGRAQSMTLQSYRNRQLQQQREMIEQINAMRTSSGTQLGRRSNSRGHQTIMRRPTAAELAGWSSGGGVCRRGRPPVAGRYHLGGFRTSRDGGISDLDGDGLDTPQHGAYHTSHARMSKIYGRNTSLGKLPSITLQSSVVHFYHMGTYTFKGGGEQSMVSVNLQELDGRSFPADPPGGKGGRIVERRGLLQEVRVPLMDITSVYKREWEDLQEEQRALMAGDIEVVEGDSLSPAPFTRKSMFEAVVEAHHSGSSASAQGPVRTDSVGMDRPHSLSDVMSSFSWRRHAIRGRSGRGDGAALFGLERPLNATGADQDGCMDVLEAEEDAELGGRILSSSSQRQHTSAQLQQAKQAERASKPSRLSKVRWPKGHSSKRDELPEDLELPRREFSMPLPELKDLVFRGS